MEEYTVKEGDTFSSIAEHFYGQGDREHYEKIWRANRHVPGVGPTPDDLNYEYDGKPVVIEIPDDDERKKPAPKGGLVSGRV